MDSYDQFDATKIEKAKAMHRYRTFQKFATIVRTLEIFVVLGIISYWSLFRSSEFLPATFDFSGAFLRRVRGLLFSPHFVFLLGNAIIVALFANSSEKASSEQVSAGIVYSGEFVTADKSVAGDTFSGEWRVEEREPEVAKAVVYVPPPAETKTAAIKFPGKIERESINVVEKMEDKEKKIYRRSKSTVEKVTVIREEEVKEKEKEKIELRRSKTVPRRKSKKEEETMAGRRRRRMMSDVDDLSNEEFRRRVEAFIEKQQKFLREESSKAIVLTH